MVGTSALRVNVVYWQRRDGIASRISSVLKDLGCDTSKTDYDAKLPEGLDVVFAHGPFGSLVPLANQLLTRTPSQRPLFVLWMTEQLPNPTLPEWARYTVGTMRSQVERLAFREHAPGEWQPHSPFRWLTTKAFRFRYYGDLYWLHRQSILSRLAVTSQWTADFLHARGFNPTVAYMGSHPDWGTDLGLERDIPVLWLGKIATGRRRHLLEHLRAELKQSNHEILIIDGVENPYVFGEERTVLLNRTKIILNLLREKHDDNSMRYYLSALNRALIITEPTLPHTPFLAGVHLVEAPIVEMANTIRYYLSHEEERRRIVEQAYQLVTTDLTFRNAVDKILDGIVTAHRIAMS